MKCECQKCGYGTEKDDKGQLIEWESKKNRPKCCPRCKSYWWDRPNKK